MGFYHSPSSIATEGLVVFFDAMNPKSYAGSGSTWFDMSGSGNNGSLLYGAAYNSANGGSIAFDGTNDEVSVAHNAASMNFSAAQTICMWLKPTHTGNNTTRRNPYNQAYGGPGTITYEADWCCSGVHTFNYFFGTNGGDGEPYVNANSVFTVIAQELAFITVTRNQATNSCNWYKNGKLVSSTTAGWYASTTNGTSPIRIGSGYAGAFLGNIYNTMVYNRALTAAEVEQNFNALRGRFGL